jgi:hypothetical protein
MTSFDSKSEELTMATKRTRAPFIAGLCSIVPLLIGAKGCDAVVGTEPKPCGGLTGASCERNQFCDFAPTAMCGAADATGLCRPIPDGCDQQYAPVCGCDDQTYGNACTAHVAGVSVASDGECAGGACGGLLGTQCPADEFCNFPADAICGFADATGTCEPRPDGCAEILMPVCGCDALTYTNACEANRAGITVASEAECDDP